MVEENTEPVSEGAFVAWIPLKPKRKYIPLGYPFSVWSVVRDNLVFFFLFYLLHMGLFSLVSLAATTPQVL